jgi:hypothetical protein
MRSRRVQIVFFALLAVLLVGRGILGSPQTPTIQEMWRQLTR